jgi:hypothetical protein
VTFEKQSAVDLVFSTTTNMHTIDGKAVECKRAVPKESIQNDKQKSNQTPRKTTDSFLEPVRQSDDLKVPRQIEVLLSN